MFLSESTVRASLKITGAVAAALAFSLAGTGSALADPSGPGAADDDLKLHLIIPT